MFLDKHEHIDFFFADIVIEGKIGKINSFDQKGILKYGKTIIGAARP